MFFYSVAIGSAGYFASVHLLPDMAHLSPFTYLNVAEITYGEVATLLNNSGIHVLTGGVVLLVAVRLLIVVGYVLLGGRDTVFKKRGIALLLIVLLNIPMIGFSFNLRISFWDIARAA